VLPEARALNRIKKIMSGPPEDYSTIKKILIDENLLIKTDDDTLTIRAESESELMHSKIGAIKEAFEKFVEPSNIKKIEYPRILDLCSGLGYNSLAALIQNSESRIDMLEISREIIFLSRYLNNEYAEKKILNKAIDSFFSNQINSKIKIFCADARIYIKNIDSGIYDIIFHDGFSPANDPVLYTVDFLSLLYSSMRKDGVLLSYSSSIPFRSALIESGFYIGEGPSIGRKRGITIAAKAKDDYRIKSRLSFDDEKLIALSSIGLPYRDHKLSENAEAIHAERNRKRTEYKKLYKNLSTKKIKKNLIDEKYIEIYRNHTNSRESVLAMQNYLLTKQKN
jgi:tRNA U34 5-methylaminomethyl-2-thiouridine-forming methyltransferase MnmC